MTTIATNDGTTIYFKDWGSGRPVVLSHGWPLNADSWESQALHLASNGFRVISHDRRGHGRSSQPWDGNDMDHYADDRAQLIEHLTLEHAFLVGFSTGGGEVARYVGRHGTRRVAKLALISAVPPLMVKTAATPDGILIEVPDGLRAASLADRSKLYQDLASGPFFGFNRPGATPCQGMIDLVDKGRWAATPRQSVRGWLPTKPALSEIWHARGHTSPGPSTRSGCVSAGGQRLAGRSSTGLAVTTSHGRRPSVRDRGAMRAGFRSAPP